MLFLRSGRGVGSTNCRRHHRRESVSPTYWVPHACGLFCSAHAVFELGQAQLKLKVRVLELYVAWSKNVSSSQGSIRGWRWSQSTHSFQLCSSTRGAEFLVEAIPSLGPFHLTILPILGLGMWPFLRRSRCLLHLLSRFIVHVPPYSS